MAIGDVTQLKLLQKALDQTATNSTFANTANNVTTVTSISIANTASIKRTVTLYGYGTATANTVSIIPLEPKASVILTGLDYVLSNTEAFFFTQDVGTDVIVTVMGIREVIA